MTLFPDYFKPFLDLGVIGSYVKNNHDAIQVHLIDIRDYSMNKYRSVDDTPFGGGPGMVIRADVLARALQEGVIARGGYTDEKKLRVIFTSPRGMVWDQAQAKKLAGEIKTADMVFVCGRYEGIDERFIQKYVTDIFSLGDFVLTGGEVAVMSILDSTLRLLPGVLGNNASTVEESFEKNLLEHPQYTRPREFEGMEIPEILMTGHHEKMTQYQLELKKKMTQTLRPDLWEKYLKEGGKK